MLGIDLLEKNMENDRETYRPTERDIEFLTRYIEATNILRNTENSKILVDNGKKVLVKNNS